MVVKIALLTLNYTSKLKYTKQEELNDAFLVSFELWWLNFKIYFGCTE